MCTTLGAARLIVGLAVAVIIGGHGLAANGQSSPKAAMLEQTGWDALASNKPDVAEDAFRAAIALDPKNAWLQLGAGTAAFLRRDDVRAKQYLEQALALDPKLTSARALFARLMYRTGDLLGAISVLETVVSEAPDDLPARAMLDRWRRELLLHNDMRTAVGDLFTVAFEGPEDAELAAEALQMLDRAYWRITSALDARPTSTVPVILYSREQFRDITRSPAWAAGAFDGKIRVPVRGGLTNKQELERVLAHEFVHAFVRDLASTNVPTWLNEGLAGALELDNIDRAQADLRSASEVPPLDALKTSFGKLSAAAATAAYAVSAVAVRRLLDEGGGTAMANLLRDLGAGEPFEQAFERRMNRSLADFQAALTLR